MKTAVHLLSTDILKIVNFIDQLSIIIILYFQNRCKSNTILKFSPTFMSYKTVIFISSGIMNVLIKRTIFTEFYILTSKLLLCSCYGTNWQRSVSCCRPALFCFLDSPHTTQTAGPDWVTYTASCVVFFSHFSVPSRRE